LLIRSENIIFTDAEEWDKTVSLVIKSEGIPKFVFSMPFLMFRREYQKSGINLVEKEKSLNCRNSIYSSLKCPTDLQAQEGKMQAHIYYRTMIFCEILNCSGIYKIPKLAGTPCSSAGVSKLRPAGQMRPAKTFHPAREAILSNDEKKLPKFC